MPPSSSSRVRRPTSSRRRSTRSSRISRRRAETDLKALMTTQKVELDESKGDKKGPVSIAAAASAPVTASDSKPDADAPKPETRVVVIGDSDFATNSTLGIQGNKDLFM